MLDSEENGISIYSGSGCSSKIGKVDGIQSLSLGSGCDRMATIMHEFTHALGLKHTQARPDRDDAVTIMYENIKEGKEHNFDKADDFSYMTMGSGYD